MGKFGVIFFSSSLHNNVLLSQKMILRCTISPEEKNTSGKQKLTQRACTSGKEKVLWGQIIISKISSSLDKDIAMRNDR